MLENRLANDLSRVRGRFPSRSDQTKPSCRSVTKRGPTRGCFIQTEAKPLRDTFSSRSTNSQLQTTVVDVDVVDVVVVVDESILQDDSSEDSSSLLQTLTTKPLQSRSARYPYRFRKVLTGIMAEPPSGSRVSNSHTFIIVCSRF